MRGTEELGADHLGGRKAGAEAHDLSWSLWGKGAREDFLRPSGRRTHVSKGAWPSVFSGLRSVEWGPSTAPGCQESLLSVNAGWVFWVEITEESTRWAELIGELSRRTWWGVTDAGLRPWARPCNAGEGRELPKGCDFERSSQFYLKRLRDLSWHPGHTRANPLVFAEEDMWWQVTGNDKAVSIVTAGGGNCLQEELSVTLQTNATRRASRGHVPRIPDNRLETLPFQGDTKWDALLFRQVGRKQEAVSSAQMCWLPIKL